MTDYNAIKLQTAEAATAPKHVGSAGKIMGPDNDDGIRYDNGTVLLQMPQGSTDAVGSKDPKDKNLFVMTKFGPESEFSATTRRAVAGKGAGDTLVLPGTRQDYQVKIPTKPTEADGYMKPGDFDLVTKGSDGKDYDIAVRGIDDIVFAGNAGWQASQINLVAGKKPPGQSVKAARLHQEGMQALSPADQCAARNLAADSASINQTLHHTQAGQRDKVAKKIADGFKCN